MQVQHIGYRIRGFYRVAATGDAFGVSRRTLYPNLGKAKLHVLLGPR